MECGDWSPLFAPGQNPATQIKYRRRTKSGDQSPHSRKHYLLWLRRARNGIAALQKAPPSLVANKPF
jgi:hypothetical protein